MFNVFTGRILPKWVTGLPDNDANKHILKQIHGASKKPLESPRIIIFTIKDFSDSYSAQAAASEYLDKEG